MSALGGEGLLLPPPSSARGQRGLARAAGAAASRCASGNRCRLNGTLQGSVLLRCCQH